MKHRQFVRIAVAVAASLGIHFAAAMVATPSAPPVLVEGGETAQIAMLGSSFEDLLQGSDHVIPARPLPANRVEAEVAPSMKPVRPAVTEPARSAEIVSVVPTAAELAATSDAAIPTVPAVAAGTVPVAAQQPAPPEKTQPVEANPVAKRELPADSRDMAALMPSHVTETVRALADTSATPVPTARPPRPGDEGKLAKARESQPRRKIERAKVANAARGNSDRNARTGRSDGRVEAKAKSGGKLRAGTAARAGNAKASNYPGKVYSKIRRTRQKRAGGSGVARIGFSITANGGLASARVVASSGSPAVDKVALDHIRRSAPFPPPPPGAKRQFVIPVEVRR
ncbi:energy transducer TonB family protein [Oricola thermophila]|uniref:TonB family protein n=1 Tax=Oricola thermophila TaxID=2742145 RepID=A0A6N1VHJ8_9HYPH|nr:TonB family protein [Oricola thermophila]QKV20381.1 TonB family protein [Oricola thermophila]